MKTDLNELQAWVKEVCEFELPNYKELPGIKLYMEQVLDYINEVLTVLNPYEKDLVTSFMVNNYVKAKIIKMPEKKKYDKEHLGYLIFIASLKRTLSLNELATLIELDDTIPIDKPVLYGFYRSMSKDIIQDRAAFLDKKIDMIKAQYDKDIPVYGEEIAKQKLLEGLSLTALRFAVKAAVDQLFSEALIQKIKSIQEDSDDSKDPLEAKKVDSAQRQLEETESEEIAKKKEEKAHRKAKAAKKYKHSLEDSIEGELQ